jgi:ligand-binding SRPBCC domain-containing protein
MVRHLLQREQLVRRPLADVFAFFADARNLEVLTPPFLRFRILTQPPIAMRAGTLIDYQIRLVGISMRWKTLIESFEPGHRFVDVQLSGPYKAWRHEHEFVAVPDGTLVKDRVMYEMPLGLVGELGRAVVVKRTLGRIFDYRSQAIAKVVA